MLGVCSEDSRCLLTISPQTQKMTPQCADILWYFYVHQQGLLVHPNFIHSNLFVFLPDVWHLASTVSPRRAEHANLGPWWPLMASLSCRRPPAAPGTCHRHCSRHGVTVFFLALHTGAADGHGRSWMVHQRWKERWKSHRWSFYVASQFWSHQRSDSAQDTQATVKGYRRTERSLQWTLSLWWCQVTWHVNLYINGINDFMWDPESMMSHMAKGKAQRDGIIVWGLYDFVKNTNSAVSKTNPNYR